MVLLQPGIGSFAGSHAIIADGKIIAAREPKLPLRIELCD